MNTSYSQIGQDTYYLENISKNKKNGFFLDIGANDGILTSNTAKLEFEYGWSGICIEANLDLITDLTKNRPNSKVVHSAVWNSSGIVEFEIPVNNVKNTKGHLLSRISNIDRNQKGFRKDTIIKKVQIQAKTITDILKEIGKLPCIIDYMSLDIEGAELEALKGIDFSQIDIKFMTVEHGDRPGYLFEIDCYLKQFGYKIHRVNKWDVEFEKCD
jgi:FkbM family methyltransferase